MNINFTGSETARLFSAEIDASLNGIIDNLMISDASSENSGFVFESFPDIGGWNGTMWSRDAGVFLRELTEWGIFDKACLLCNRLIMLVDKNSEGYYMFPEYFERGDKKSGSELDGTSAIIIAMIKLYGKLEKEDRTGKEIFRFLSCGESPVEYMLLKSGKQSLLEGSGEFGGGCYIEGLHINSVQNNLVLLALLSSSDFFKEAGLSAKAEECLRAANRIREGIKKHLIDENNAFIWCIEPGTMKPDERIINHPINKGAGHINGILTMSADVLGFNITDENFSLLGTAKNTFYRLLNTPLRRELFEKYGIWTQFDGWWAGFTGPSYGHGYAIMAMLLLNRLDLAKKALDYLAHETAFPIKEYKIRRRSPYYFYERYYCPYSVECGQALDEGCGELNLVCASEPLKIARMIAGIDTSDGVLKLIPKMPEGFDSYTAKDVPMLQNGRLVLLDVKCQRQGEKLNFRVTAEGSERLDCIEIRKGEIVRIFQNINSLNASL